MKRSGIPIGESAAAVGAGFTVSAIKHIGNALQHSDHGTILRHIEALAHLRIQPEAPALMEKVVMLMLDRKELDLAEWIAYQFNVPLIGSTIASESGLRHLFDRKGGPALVKFFSNRFDEFPTGLLQFAFKILLSHDVHSAALLFGDYSKKMSDDDARKLRASCQNSLDEKAVNRVLAKYWNN
jgi:hypothetical protein